MTVSASPRLQENLHEMFTSLLECLAVGPKDTAPNGIQATRQSNALKTLIIYVEAMLSKDFGGWEIMEIFAGSVSASDTVFMRFVTIVHDLLASGSTPADFKSDVLRLALKFVGGVNELSVGAYFLRRDLYAPLFKILSGTDIPVQVASNSAVLVGLLANYHKADAANLNPYLQHIYQDKNEESMRALCRVVYAQCLSTIEKYRAVQDDAPPTLASSFTTAFTSITPDFKGLSLLPTSLSGNSTPGSSEASPDSFKNLPPIQALSLHPLYEFIRSNLSFPIVSAQPFQYSATDAPGWVKSSGQAVLLPSAVLSLSSYVLTHATASNEPRAGAYAQACLTIMLTWVRNPFVVKLMLVGTEKDGIGGELRLCRQRTPHLPLPKKDRPMLCSLLDCCVLWLRHNLHKNLQGSSYITCMYIVNCVIRFLHQERSRLEYHWVELWRAIIGLLDYMWSKAESLKYSSTTLTLVQLTIRTLALAIYADFLPQPADIHQLVYEISRSAALLSKQSTFLATLNAQSSSPSAHKTTSTTALSSSKSLTERAQITVARHSEICLTNLLRISAHYASKFTQDELRSATAVMKRIADEVGKEGVFLGNANAKGSVGVGELKSEDVMQEEKAFETLLVSDQSREEATFIRWACRDAMRV